MDEEKEKQTEIPADKDSKEGDEPKANTLIEQADLAAQRLEKANQEAADLVRRQENLAAKRMLGGQTAGGEREETPKVESPSEYMKRVMSGGLNEKPREED